MKSTTAALTRRVALTDRSLQGLRAAPKGKRVVLWDAILPGLAVRATDSGARSFFAVRRRAGKSTPSWIRLGSYPETLADGLTLAAAREKARGVLGALIEGRDPTAIAEERRREQVDAAKAAAAEEARARADSFASVAADFVEQLEAGRIRKVRGGGGELRKADEIARSIRREFLGQKPNADGGWDEGEGGGRWAGRPIADISRRDVREAIEAIFERNEKNPANGRRSGGPYAARHSFAAARRLFNWAVRRDLLERSPCEGLRAVDLHGAPTARARVLSDAELKVVWESAVEVGYPFGDLVRILLLTGGRLNELAGASWPEITDNLLTVPAERMKGNCVWTFPIVPAATEILDGVPRFDSGKFIFTTTAGARPISGFSKMKSALDKVIAEKAEIAHWTLHDLRRTVRTGLSSVGVLPVVAELCLAHKQTGISSIYDRHTYDAEKRDALERWSARLMSIVAPAPAPKPRRDNVFQMKWRRA